MMKRTVVHELNFIWKNILQCGLCIVEYKVLTTEGETPGYFVLCRAL